MTEREARSCQRINRFSHIYLSRYSLSMKRKRAEWHRKLLESDKETCVKEYIVTLEKSEIVWVRKKSRWHLKTTLKLLSSSQKSWCVGPRFLLSVWEFYRKIMVRPWRHRHFPHTTIDISVFIYVVYISIDWKIEEK